jgi:glycosyltransferase involved in cell wall biosynthesis
MIKEKSLTIVMPAHNEAESIEDSVTRLRSRLSGVDFKLILVDDGSTDGTAQICESLLDKDTELVSYKENIGKGHALKVGLLRSDTEFSAYLDSDLDLHPDGILTGLVELLANEDLALVAGSKFHSKSEVNYPKSRRVVSGLYRGLVWTLFRLPIRDTQVGLKVYRTKDVLPQLRQVASHGWAFDLELLARLHLGGNRIAEIPVSLDYQFTSSVGIWSGIKAIIDTVLVFKQLRLTRQVSRRTF